MPPCGPSSSPRPSPPPPKPSPVARIPIITPGIHRVLGTPIAGPWPDGTQVAVFGLGCFWGDEKDFWQVPGVVSTAVGYAGGHTPNPTYEEVCSGKTGHAEVVQVAFDPAKVSLRAAAQGLLGGPRPDPGHAPGQRRRHAATGRSSSSTNDEQRRLAEASRDAFQERLTAAGYGAITTEIRDLDAFYYAEDYHQQYLDKNPRGYCPNHSTGVQLPDDFVVTPLQYVEG